MSPKTCNKNKITSQANVSYTIQIYIWLVYTGRKTINFNKGGVGGWVEKVKGDTVNNSKFAQWQMITRFSVVFTL